MAGMYRRKSRTFAAEIGCSEDEYLERLRAGYEWCSRCVVPDEEARERGVSDATKIGRWVKAEYMSSNTVRMCKACQAASVRRRSRERQSA